MRWKQSVKKGVWYIGGKIKYKKRKQRGKGFPMGLLVSAAVPILGRVTKPISKKDFGGGKRRRRRWEKKQRFVDNLSQ